MITLSSAVGSLGASAKTPRSSLVSPGVFPGGHDLTGRSLGRDALLKFDQACESAFLVATPTPALRQGDKVGSKRRAKHWMFFFYSKPLHCFSVVSLCLPPQEWLECASGLSLGSFDGLINHDQPIRIGQALNLASFVLNSWKLDLVAEISVAIQYPITDVSSFVIVVTVFFVLQILEVTQYTLFSASKHIWLTVRRF